MENKMPENLKELLRRVFSVDTEAGERLRYHIMRALACKKYRKKIGCGFKATSMTGIFIWSHTFEKHDYWSNINKLVNKKRLPVEDEEPLDVPF